LNVRLTELQKRLCNALQNGLPVCSRPFADLAEFLGADEKTVLQQIEQLKKMGVIRRISALINYQALGLTGTLVAAHVPDENLKEVAGAVNSLRNVSHNYLRGHHYNLWFTLQGDSYNSIELELSNLAGRFGIDFHSLPLKRIFKLDVRFDAENQGQQFSDVEQVAAAVERKEEKAKVELTTNEKVMLAKLQDDLDVTVEPFDFLCSEGLASKEVLKIVKGLIDKGVIRRIAAVVDHRKLGFAANVLFCSDVPQESVVRAGERLARFRIVSHCYERQTFEGWPYNVFAMMHAASMGQIQHVINRFVEMEKIDAFELLPTTAELKKKPVKYQFE